MPNDEPLSYCAGRYVPFSQATVPLWDAGFVLGTTISEQLRSFQGKLFAWEEHLARLRHSAETVGLQDAVVGQELLQIAQRLIEHNYPLLPEGGDLGLAVLLTPGAYGNFSASQQAGPNWYLHTYPLAFHRWTENYRHGVSLRLARTRQVPPNCWPASLKCRSRMHYYLADREVAAEFPGEKALLLDQAGNINETSTANVLLCQETPAGPRVLSPPEEAILPGISRAYALRLAADLGWEAEVRPLAPAEVHHVAEVWLTSTPFCLLPVCTFEGKPIGTGKPGPRYQQLLQAWSDAVGVSIADQARKVAEVTTAGKDR